ncbi:MAG: TetR/AcrR family transcriptional regulator C-terminal domain-containing protein [Lachnospiraceae bacterium]
MNVKADVEKLLMESFKKLVMTVPVEKITIKDITDEAGVIRPTFYNHFQDKYEVIERIVNEEILVPVKPLLENEMLHEAMVLIFTNILKDKEFYCRLSGMEGQNSFASIVKNSIRKWLFGFISVKVGTKKFKSAWLTPERVSDYYAQSMSFVVLEWIASGMTISPAEVAEIYHYIMTRSMEDILQELEEG